MKALNVNDVQLISAGCPVCPIVPGACVAAAGASLATAYLGWEKTIVYVLGLAAIGLGVYWYSLSDQDGHDHHHH